MENPSHSSIFDVFNCRLPQKIGKICIFGVISITGGESLKFGIFANQNAYFTKNLYEDPEYLDFHHKNSQLERFHAEYTENLDI